VIANARIELDQLRGSSAQTFIHMPRHTESSRCQAYQDIPMPAPQPQSRLQPAPGLRLGQIRPTSHLFSFCSPYPNVFLAVRRPLFDRTAGHGEDARIDGWIVVRHGHSGSSRECRRSSRPHDCGNAQIRSCRHHSLQTNLSLVARAKLDSSSTILARTLNSEHLQSGCTLIIIDRLRYLPARR
jgi:hypothetical protein